MAFPTHRPRRLRTTPALRRLVAETRLGVDDLIAPLFVREGVDTPVPIASMPGVVQHTRDSLVKEVGELVALGIPGVILFGVPEHKDPRGLGASDPFAPGLGLKNAALVSFGVSTVLILVMAVVSGGDAIFGELPFTVLGFLIFFVIFWLMIAWIF